MKIILRSLLPVTILAASALVAPVQAQTTQDQQPAQAEAVPTDRIGIDASDPYSEQVYSGSQDPNTPNSDPMNERPNDGMTNQSEAAPTDRIGIDASDPYSEQVYSGSQDPNMTNEGMNNNGLDTSFRAGQDQSSLSRLQEMRYQVLDRSNS